MKQALWWSVDWLILVLTIYAIAVYGVDFVRPPSPVSTEPKQLGTPVCVVQAPPGDGPPMAPGHVAVVGASMAIGGRMPRIVLEAIPVPVDSEEPPRAKP